MARVAEFDALARELAGDGWDCTRTGGGHVRFTRPGFQALVAPSTPSDPRAFANFLSDARRIYREKGEQLPRERPAAPKSTATGPDPGLKVPANLADEYNTLREANDDLAGKNAVLWGEVETLRGEVAALSSARKIEDPGEDPAAGAVAAVLSPFAPFFAFMREVSARLDSLDRDVHDLKRDTRVLDRLATGLRDRLNGLPAVEPVAADPVPRTRGPRSDEARFNQLLTFDRSAGPPRPGMLWKTRGKGGRWTIPRPSYCWECGTELPRGGYFCGTSHGKKYTRRHPDRAPVRPYRTRADMSWEEAQEQNPTMK